MATVKKETTGFGIIGLGMIAGFHVKALEGIPGCRFAAGFDSLPGRAESFCSSNGGKPYDSLDKFLADSDLDIVTVASPSGLHMEGALAALGAGKHVIVEKPLEVSSERCDRIIAEAEKNGVRLGTIFPSRYHEAPKLVKKAIESGRLGKIVMASAQVKWWRTQEYYDSGKWRGTWKFDGGGALMNQGIHAIDLLQWLVGKVAEVSAYTATLAHERIEVEDTGAAALRFENGALGSVEASTGAYPGFFKKIEICGNRGCVTLAEENIIAWEFDREESGDAEIREKFRNMGTTGGGADDPAAIGLEGHRMLFEDFVAALREDRPFGIEGPEGKKAVEIIEAIYRSAKNRVPVLL
jgi:predicted dehydrogenase